MLTFFGADDIDTIREVPLTPFRSVGATRKHKFDSIRLGDLSQTTNVFARDDVCVKAYNSRPQTANGVFEIRKVVERGIENLDRETGSLQISGKIENSQRRVRFHHTLLDDVVFQKIGVA